MSRDYAKQRALHERGSEPSRSGWVWLLAGVLIGLFVAGLAFLNRHDNSVKNIPAEPARVVKKATPIKSEKAKAAVTPRFDFYTMLPKNQTPAADQADAETPTETAAAPPASPTKMTSPAEATTETTTPATTSFTAASEEEPVSPPAVTQREATPKIENPAASQAPAKKPAATPQPSAPYIIAIAAFKRYQEADQLKAQLSLLGFDANITSVKSKNLRIYRVWLGPYVARNSAEKELHRLKDNHLDGVLSKKHP